MTREEILEWLNEWIADLLGVSPEDIEKDRTLASLGLDADDIESLESDIEEFFEERLESGIVRARSTVSSLTRYLCELTGTDEDDDFGTGALEGAEADNLLRDIGL